MLDEWRQIIDPVQTIFVKYWRSWRGMLLLLLVIVIASSAASIGAPYVFSRLVDRLTTDRWAETSFTVSSSTRRCSALPPFSSARRATLPS